MKKLWLIEIVLFAVISVGLVFAQTNERPFASEVIEVGQTPVVLTADTYGAFASSALLSTNMPIIYTLDGTTPTLTVGHWANGELLLNMYQLRSVKMITASDLATNTVTVQITYFRK